jgi:FkbM family methyltransferase
MEISTHGERNNMPTSDYIKRLITNPKQTYERFKIMEARAGRYCEIFEEQAYLWLYEKIKPGTTLIDIGANIGDTAIYFAMNHNVKKIIAYEPFPKNYEYAKEALSRNPLKNKIELKNVAISASGKTRRISKEIEGLGMDYDKTENVDEGISIKSITLNQALGNLKKVAIKSDCEGAEGTFFDDANLKNAYALQIEYHWNRDKVIKTLKSKGYKIKFKENPSEKGVGFIYAWI